jgi:Leucine-rich repeat (LRR) protein
MKALSNLVTLDVSSNLLETLNDVEKAKKLKRLIAARNNIKQLSPVSSLVSLVELDFEANPISRWSDVLPAVSDKKDILVLNLKSTPVMKNVKSL